MRIGRDHVEMVEVATFDSRYHLLPCVDLAGHVRIGQMKRKGVEASHQFYLV